MLKNIKNLLLSLLVVGKHLFKKPVTLEYPEKSRSRSQYFRGKLTANGNCIKCLSCLKVCPTGAIKLNKNENEIIKEIEVDLKKCIFCGNCTFYCPKNIFKMTNEYELATENKSDLILKYPINSEVNNNE